jgi:hypothetical protein
VPLIWRPGDAAPVDFFEVPVEVAGEWQNSWRFVVPLVYSACNLAWLYESCNQFALLDGHVRPRALLWRGGANNLKATVKRRLGIGQELSARFLALCSHYLLRFARPGEGMTRAG